MSFLAPGWILIAGLGSMVVAAIHLIAWQLPRAVVLPTARFVPDEPARRAARTIRPSDLALLALRIAILMTAGLALARPILRSPPTGTASVIVVERFADTTQLRTQLAGVPRGERSVFVVFDTSAQVVSDERSALQAALDTNSGASISVGLLAAIREARVLGRDYEKVGITLVSTFDGATFDAATGGVRSTWTDSIRLVRLSRPSEGITTGGPELDGDVDDPVIAGIRLAQANDLLRGPARVARARLTAADSAFASGGGAVIDWPRVERGESHVAGIHAENATTIGHFIVTPLSESQRVVARWTDGRPAATESMFGRGCVRTIGFDVPDVGDFAVSTGFQRLAAALLAPCGRQRTLVVASDSLLAMLVTPPSQASAAGVPDELTAANRLAAVFMLAAVLLAIAELLWRRRLPARRALVEAA